MVFSKGRITFYRGDDDALMVALKDGHIFHEGDTVFFSLKAQDEDLTDILQIESTTFVPYVIAGIEVADAAALITIPHSATIDLELGKYYYDILITWADGRNATVVPPVMFKLVPGGSHDQP